MKSWHKNWDVISPIFKFSSEVRKVIYTTNAIESLNSTYRKLNRQRSVFPIDTALLKALYLATFEATKKWTIPLRNWGKVYGELSVMYEGGYRYKLIIKWYIKKLVKFFGVFLAYHLLLVIVFARMKCVETVHKSLI